MNEIGTVLREARENRGFELNDVYEALRISPKYIKAMESGQYDLLPSQTHVRGYLRKYARFLGLDAEPLIERYNQFREKAPLPSLRPVEEEPLPKIIPPPEDEAGTFFDHLNNDLSLEENQSRSDYTGWLIIAALVFFIGLLSWRFLPFVLGNEPNNSFLQGITTAVGDLLGEESTDTTTLPENGVLEAEPLESTIELVVPTSRTSGSTATVGEDGTSGVASEGGTEIVLPEATPTRNPLPATLEIINLQIDITERAWVSLTVDEIVVFEGQATRGDTFTYTANDSVRLRTGNGAGVVVRINEIDLGRIGDRQQVVDQLWETTQ